MVPSLAFFGAFNPPTRAHIDLAEIAMQAEGAGHVIFVPSKSSYITGEQKKGFAFSDGDRIEMLKKIAGNRPWVRWTDIEMHQPVQPRTYTTLCMLREQGEQPSLLLGADKLCELDRLWRNVREIADEFGIVCIDRGEIDCGQMIASSPFLRSLNIRTVHVPDEYRNISSTQVREYLQQLYVIREGLRDLLPPELGDLPSELIKIRGKEGAAAAG